MSTTYTFWHGARRWEGPPAILPPKKGRDCGPGICVTTSFDHAQSFAKRGGAVRKIVMTPRLVLEEAALSLNDAMDFVTTVVSKAKQGDVLERMMVRANKMRLDDRVLLGTDNEHISAEMLVILCINDDLALGSKGLALAEFLVEQGIDCSFDMEKNNQHSGTIFNPQIIHSWAHIKSVDLGDTAPELPSPARQRELALEALKKRKSDIVLPQTPGF